MRRIAWLVVLAVLAVLAALGCSSPRDVKTPATVAEMEPPPFSTPDQDVPLVAPDEADAAKTSPRLTETKRIGGGPDDTSVDGKHRGTTAQASTRAATTAPRTTLPRARGYARGVGTGAYSSSTSNSTPSFGATSPVPAVGAAYPSAPSFGTPAAH